MTADADLVASPPAEAIPEPEAASEAADRWSRPYAGWIVVAGKEFTDHLLSIRFVVLLLILGLAAAVPLFFGAEYLRSLASNADFDRLRREGQLPAIFLALFYLGSDPASSAGVALPGVVDFMRWFAPLLGIAFAFDAVNGERAEGTLPRLVSQPIHRDDVVNGKFAAGLAVIALVLTSVLAFIAGVGLLRLGLVPAPTEILRLLFWLFVTLLYVSLWLAFGMLLSVVVRRAATSALIGFGTWFTLTFLGQLVVSFIAGLVAPLSDSLAASNPSQYLSNSGVHDTLFRVLPDTLYREASVAILNPSVTTTSSNPANLAQLDQLQQQIGSTLSLDQTFAVIWPQLVALLALTAVCFAVAYISFIRQEVRA